MDTSSLDMDIERLIYRCSSYHLVLLLMMLFDSSCDDWRYYQSIDRLGDNSQVERNNRMYRRIGRCNLVYWYSFHMLVEMLVIWSSLMY